MRISITSRNVEVSDNLRNLIEKKIKKLGRYFREGTEVLVGLNVERNRHIMEVTVYFDGIVIRAEDHSGDMYTTLDNVLHKLERRIRKYRTRLEKKLHEGAFASETPVFGEADEQEELVEPKVVRTKNFTMKPMSVDEAIMQMDLLGHNFFVFRNEQSLEVNVVYRRNNGDFGLIEPGYQE
ncbi:MAG: ribosome hibernation-promoting factor, HPF/YfiA family [Bacillota bacterium]